MGIVVCTYGAGWEVWNNRRRLVENTCEKSGIVMLMLLRTVFCSVIVGLARQGRNV